MICSGVLINICRRASREKRRGSKKRSPFLLPASLRRPGLPVCLRQVPPRNWSGLHISRAPSSRTKMFMFKGALQSNGSVFFSFPAARGPCRRVAVLIKHQCGYSCLFDLLPSIIAHLAGRSRIGTFWFRFRFRFRSVAYAACERIAPRHTWLPKKELILLSKCKAGNRPYMTGDSGPALSVRPIPQRSQISRRDGVWRSDCCLYNQAVVGVRSWQSRMLLPWWYGAFEKSNLPANNHQGTWYGA